MITVAEQNISTIPSLVVTRADQQNDPLPTVIYFHGFTSAKEHNLPFAYLLARKGFRVILPDSLHHGAREEEISELDMQLSFWDVVLKNIEELEIIKQYLQEKNYLLNDQIGVAGTSMGGITTSAALRKYPWIKAGAILMGSPQILKFADELLTVVKKTNVVIPEEDMQQILNTLEKIDLSKDIAVLNERPLYLWHGEDDQVVPFNHTYTFYNEAKKYYSNKKLIRFDREENRDHKVSRPAILETVEWFNTYLK